MNIITNEEEGITMSIEKIVGNIHTIQGIFKKYGFENVRLFMGFGPLDKKTFYLTASLETKGEDWFADATKKRDVEGKLKELLGFYVHITYEMDMEKDSLADINRPKGSVNLSEVVEKATLKEKLEDYFGKYWEFDITGPYADHKPKPPTPEMLAFPKMVEKGTHPIFGTEKKGPLSEESANKRIEAGMNEFNNKLSEFKVEELKVLRERLLQSIDQKLSESQPMQKST